MSEGVLSMNVNFEYYRIFYYVAKYHNFTKAAHTLGSSQPNVTRAMNCLEQQINTTLFVRTNRGIQLTPEGEKLYTHISAAMSQIFAAEEELSDSTGLSHGSISIGVSEKNRLCYCFNSSFRGITTQTDYAAAFSGNPCRWYNFYRTRQPGIISRRIKKLSADFAWT